MALKTTGEIIGEGFEKLQNLREFLNKVKEVAPDLSSEADDKIAALDAAVDATSLLALGGAVISELKNIPNVGLTGRSHPHTVTGG